MNTQHTRFLETARQLGCNEDEAAFDKKLKAVVGSKRPNPRWRHQGAVLTATAE